jgi:SAM-dependent methyltransferase
VSKYVQYGCGFTAPDGWLNFDASPTLRFERIPVLGNIYTKNKQRFPANVMYGNIIKGLPVEPDSCDGIYCSHILEHLSLKDFRSSLKNTYHILKPGGIFRCVVPDLKTAAENYLNQWEHDSNASIAFMESVLLGVKEKKKGIIGTLKDAFGNSHHLWMWDQKSLSLELENAGFKNIRLCGYGDCEDINFNSVEEEDRFNQAVAIECKK